MDKAIFSGCNNNFYICNYYDINCREIKEICDKYNTDGFIMLEINNGFIMHFYNRDSSRAPMCGNGIRCLTYFMYLNNLVMSNVDIKIKTDSGIVITKITNLNPFVVLVNLGKPKEYFSYIAKINNQEIKLEYVFLGTDHVVINGLDFMKNAKNIQKLSIFKNGCNVNFVNIIDRKNIIVNTYERGVGWTAACGSGACSSFYILNKQGLIDDNIAVHFKYDNVNVRKIDEDIYLEGKCQIDEVKI